jgi:hypothetical protein
MKSSCPGFSHKSDLYGTIWIDELETRQKTSKKYRNGWGHKFFFIGEIFFADVGDSA